MKRYPKVILRKGKEVPVKRYHPWIFSGAVLKIEGDYKEGDIAEIYSSEGQYLATGYLLSGSIAVKLLTFEQQEINKEFWKHKILKAYDLRHSIGLTDSDVTNAFRLVHYEGDSMPGLIIDLYGELAVIQAHSAAMYDNRIIFSEILQELFHGRITAIYDKSAESLRKMTGLKVTDGFLYGKGAEFRIVENGHDFIVNPVEGQKTGFFLDQRENRLMLGRYAQDKTVLNMFGYTGGFSVYAAKAGASIVHTVDSSRSAIDMAEKNAGLNGVRSNQHKGIVGDAMEYLSAMEPGSYDLIILDPPAYAKNFESRHRAFKGYQTLNTQALKKIQSGGLLFTFSCSQVVDRNSFLSILTASAIDAGKTVSVLHHLSQPPDHPINIFHQEGEYLKGLVLRVE